MPTYTVSQINIYEDNMPFSSEKATNYAIKITLDGK